MYYVCIYILCVCIYIYIYIYIYIHTYIGYGRNGRPSNGMPQIRVLTMPEDALVQLFK